MLPKDIEAKVGESFSEDQRAHFERPFGLGELGAECEGSRFHSPRPMVAYPVRLRDGAEVRLCGTCRDNLALLKRLEYEQEGVEELPWPVLRAFGNRIRELGRRTT